MEKEKNYRKIFAKEAKKRLATVTVNDVGDERYFLNNRRLTQEEIAAMENVIDEISASDEFIPNPIGRFIDKKEYELLDEPSRQKYVLDLSKIYIEIKEKKSK